MSVRCRLWLLAGCYALNFLVAAWALPVEPTQQELGAIVEQEYGRTLDASYQRGRDLPGPVQAMIQQKNMRDLMASERGIYRQERWFQRSAWTFLGGTVLAMAIVLVWNRRHRLVASHSDPLPTPE